MNYLALLEGSHVEVKTEGETGPGAHAFIGSMGGMLCGFQVMARWINSSQKNGVLISLTGVLSNQHLSGETVDYNDS